MSYLGDDTLIEGKDLPGTCTDNLHVDIEKYWQSVAGSSSVSSESGFEMEWDGVIGRADAVLR